jgi:hypothetical protein
VPGLEYIIKVATASAEGPAPQVGEAHILQPGEVKKLGDVREAAP